MNQEVLDIVKRDFNEDEIERVLTELSSIELGQVMDSQYNLDNTLLSILKISDQNLQSVVHYTERAKRDFRDVILWASQDD